MTKPTFHLTRQAALDLRAIQRHSQKQWGDQTAHDYMAKLYETLQKIASRPEAGNTRKVRSTPFLMVPAGKHFVVYDVINQEPVILTILHQNRDVEHIIADFTPAFLKEISALRTTGQKNL